MQTVSRSRIDVLADAPLVPRIVSALVEAGINGHTVLPALSGSGRSGPWTEDRLTGTETKQWVVAIASSDHAEAFVESLSGLLDSHRLLLTLSVVQVVRGDRF